MFFKNEDEEQTFTKNYNTAEDFMMAQNKPVVAGLWQQQQQNNNFGNSFSYLQNHLINQVQNTNQEQ